VVRVLVAGDPTIDDFLLFIPPKKKEQSQDWERYDRFLLMSTDGGVHLTVDTLEELAKTLGSTELTVDSLVAEQKKDGIPVALHSLVELKPTSDNDKPNGDAEPEGDTESDGDTEPETIEARVTNFRGYSLRRSEKQWSDPKLAGSSESYDIVVLNDAGGALRTSEEFAKLLAGPIEKSKLLIHKMHNNWVPTTALHKRLGQDVTKESKRRENRILHVSADDLRRNRITLRSVLTWSAALEDLERAVRTNPDLRELLRIYATVIVQFDLEGLALLRSDPDCKAVSCTLIYDSGRAEGDLTRKLPGIVYGQMNALLCTAVSAVVERLGSAGSIGLTDGDARRALASTRKYAEANFRVTVDETAPEIDSPELRLLTVRKADDDKALVKHPLALTPEGPTGFGPAGNPEKTQDLARKIVTGGDRAFRELPHAVYGKLVSVDPQEIASYREVRRVIAKYLEDDERRKPLSIAVFGDPGSGKSFGVKQITEGLGVKEMEFNLSESQADDLPGYFQEIRDIQDDGKVPLCFFDEFDRNECELVARFLAPMQDGKFRDAGRTHPIGRAILVFAGGTATTFKDFLAGKALTVEGEETEKPDSDGASGSGSDGDPIPAGGAPVSGNKDDSPSNKRAARIKSLKIPDFVSRLEGVLEIKGLGEIAAESATETMKPTNGAPEHASDPADARDTEETGNNEPKQAPEDTGWMLRRAVILRKVLERFAKRSVIDVRGEALIDGRLLDALLFTANYRSGARSLEKIVLMSALREPARGFSKSDLPSRELLDLHLKNTDAFLSVVERFETGDSDA